MKPCPLQNYSHHSQCSDKFLENTHTKQFWRSHWNKSRLLIHYEFMMVKMKHPYKDKRRKKEILDCTFYCMSWRLFRHGVKGLLSYKYGTKSGLNMNYLLAKAYRYDYTNHNYILWKANKWHNFKYNENVPFSLWFPPQMLVSCELN